ncbi:MAG: hypothetical protein ACLQQ4_12170 [Bacteroidia bacterium]
MRTLYTPHIEYDSTQYVVYQVEQVSLLVAIAKADNEKMQQLCLKYEDFDKIPPEEKLNCFPFEYDKTKGKYVLKTSIAIPIEARLLFPAFIYP